MGDARLEWIEAGQDHLREHGAAGLKIAALAARRGATTGSFYHHFANFAAYLDELADHYATVSPREAYRLFAEQPPQVRLRSLFTMAIERDIPALDRAMRVWAATNPRAEQAVRALDAEFLSYVRQAFLDLGFEEHEAQTRALMAFSVGAAIVYPPWDVDERYGEAAIELLTRR